ncbi:MAG: 1-acyl-sn-glycerol-3-phosphate acyltransferase [Alistipes sp.]|nr:1-acyl-sn-glycerol-3-phosphate acyltransferase [Alistipes sp.]
MSQTVKISIDEMIRRRWPRAAACMPQAAIRALERRLCVDRLNDYIAAHADLPTAEFLHRFIDSLQVTYTVEGMGRLNSDGRYIIASNHPFGGLDGVILAATMIDRFGDVGVVVNDLLSEIRPLESIWIPVNTRGVQRSGNVVRFEQVLRSNKPVVTFPAGLCSRRRGGRVRDTEWHSSFVKRAIMHERDIVPVYVDGRLSDRFYRMADMRRRLGIGFNLEMLRLPAEMFSQRGQHITIRMGKPLSYRDIRHSESTHDVCRKVRAKVYEMAF